MAASNRTLPRIYGLSAVLAAAVIVSAVLLSGPAAVFPILTLAIIEITFSFDNAVINSAVLNRMSKGWQTVFLTLGIAIAVFGVRFLLPLLMVGFTTGNSLGHVFDLALHNPLQYAQELEDAYPLIAAFGGIFLLMLSLRFFGEQKQIHWLRFESVVSEFNQPWWLSVTGALAGVAALYFLLAPHKVSVLISGLLGAATFLTIKGVGEFLEHSQPLAKRGVKATGLMAFSYFMYLEILDASFSFDGVIAAFAITKKVFLIAAGLGIGALFVRSMTVHLLHRNTLQTYRYLIHGAHYAIGILALMLLVTIRFHIPDLVTGLLGLIFIAAALYSSWDYNRSEANA